MDTLLVIFIYVYRGNEYDYCKLNYKIVQEEDLFKRLNW
jgi:hypothetical protein